MSEITNLPKWHGADVVYSRVQQINSIRAREEYLALHKRFKGNRAKMRMHWPPEWIREIGDAMDKGDEEVLKAYVSQHLDIILAKEQEGAE